MFGISKLNIYIIIASLVLTSGTTLVLSWEHYIKQQALLEFNNAQLDQTVKDQKKFNDALQTINDIQKTTIDDMTKQNKELQNQLSNLNAYLNSNQAVKDSGTTSEVLKRTFKELENAK